MNSDCIGALVTLAMVVPMAMVATYYLGCLNGAESVRKTQREVERMRNKERQR